MHVVAYGYSFFSMQRNNHMCDVYDVKKSDAQFVQWVYLLCRPLNHINDKGQRHKYRCAFMQYVKRTTMMVHHSWAQARSPWALPSGQGVDDTVERGGIIRGDF